MHVAIVVYTIAAVEKVFRTIGSLLLFKTGEMDRGHQCGIDHSLYLDLKIEIVDCAVVCPYLVIRVHSSCLDILHGRRICTKHPSIRKNMNSTMFATEFSTSHNDTANTMKKFCIIASKSSIVMVLMIY